MRLWLSLAFLSAAPSYGSDCSPIDLRPKLGPPLHQGDSGYCFAHSSAVLIHARLGVRVSPMQLATGYILTNPEELDAPADPAVKRLLTPAFFKSWHDSRVEEPENYAPARILGENGLLYTGGDEMQTLVAANFLGLCDEERLPTGRDVYKKYLKDIASFHSRRAKEGIPREETDLPIGEVTDPEARGKAWSFRHWVSRRCGMNRLPAEPLVPAEISLSPNLRSFRKLQRLSPFAAIARGQNRVIDTVNEQLERGNPIAIGYALSDLMPDQKADQAGGGAPSAAGVDHASVLAGRREVGGKCYYYLRNSFGNESKDYAPALKGRFENGGVWVRADELPSLYSATWLE